MTRRPRWIRPSKPQWFMSMVRRLAGPTGHPARWVRGTSAATVPRTTGSITATRLMPRDGLAATTPLGTVMAVRTVTTPTAPWP